MQTFAKYRRTLRAALLGAWLCGLALPAAAQQPFYLKDGDTVVFYGDSITEQQMYSAFVEEYVIARFPQMNVRFVHAGVGGDKVTGGHAGPIDRRLDRDVLPYKPTVVTIMLGMNDGGYKPFEQATLDQYAEGYRHILDRLAEALPGVRITLVQPSPYDEFTRPVRIAGGYNTTLRRMGAWAAEEAAARGMATADLNTAVGAALRRAAAEDTALAQTIIPDLVHPGEAGHLLMATELLKAWNAPSVVTRVALDAAAGAVLAQERTEVSDVQRTPGGLAWTQRDAGLPLFFNTGDPAIALALRHADVQEALNRQPLQVRGLAPGEYLLTIDGDVVAGLTAEALAEGIDLGHYWTPMRDQARGLHWSTTSHNDIHKVLMKARRAAEDDPQFAQAADLLERLEAREVKGQRAAAQPKARVYRLERR